MCMPLKSIAPAFCHSMPFIEKDFHHCFLVRFIMDDAHTGNWRFDNFLIPEENAVSGSCVVGTYVSVSVSRGACYLSKYRLALRSDGESNEVSKTGANPVRWFNFSNIPLVRSSTYHPCLKTICFSVRRILGSNDSKCNEILPKP